MQLRISIYEMESVAFVSSIPSPPLKPDDTSRQTVRSVVQISPIPRESGRGDPSINEVQEITETLLKVYRN